MFYDDEINLFYHTLEKVCPDPLSRISTKETEEWCLKVKFLIFHFNIIDSKNISDKKLINHNRIR